MQGPLPEPATLLEELVQALPPATMQMARDYKAFVRTTKITPPEPLWRLVFVSGGVDPSWREVAGTVTIL